MGGFDFIVIKANDFIRASRGFHRGSPRGPRNEPREFWGMGQTARFNDPDKSGFAEVKYYVSKFKNE
jgi:hypothetical protein